MNKAECLQGHAFTFLKKFIQAIGIRPIQQRLMSISSMFLKINVFSMEEQLQENYRKEYTHKCQYKLA